MLLRNRHPNWPRRTCTQGTTTTSKSPPGPLEWAPRKARKGGLLDAAMPSSACAGARRKRARGGNRHNDGCCEEGGAVKVESCKCVSGASTCKSGAEIGVSGQCLRLRRHWRGRLWQRGSSYPERCRRIPRHKSREVIPEDPRELRNRRTIVPELSNNCSGSRGPAQSRPRLAGVGKKLAQLGQSWPNLTNVGEA